MSSTPTSQASTEVSNDTAALSNGHKGFRQRAGECAQEAAASQDILLFLIAFRILNALSIKTFFQPDEYFQSLEPAWQMAFGGDSGAWITWEWKHQLRSAIHPMMFSIVYWTSSRLSGILGLSPAYHADLLIAAPKAIQAVLAALGDYYTWKLGQKVYGRGSNEAWALLALTVSSPWQWFCSTRTLSNCFETTLTVVALCLWPWHWSLDLANGDEVDEDGLRMDELGSQLDKQADERSKLRRCLLLVALTCVLRPTNLLIWICISCFALFRTKTEDRLTPFRWEDILIRIPLSSLAYRGATKREREVLLREGIICGSLILAVSALFDRLYYQMWTFPPVRFIYFNIAQSLAVLYGRNDWHYYISQGYPLLLTTFLPFALLSLYRNVISFPNSNPSDRPQSIAVAMKHQLAIVALFVPLVLSLVAHKEVRFIYPLLPILHIMAAESFTNFFLPAISPASPYRHERKAYLKKAVAIALFATNICIAIFTTQYHQPAPLSVLTYLRQQHEHYYLTQPPPLANIAPAATTMTVGFLMPCHSTPWRSHLIHPGIKAWALGCEPPVNLNASARSIYMDEADQFYDHPARFLAKNLGRPPQSKGLFGSRVPHKGSGALDVDEHAAWDGKPGKKVWPEYLVFFEQLEQTMGVVLAGSGYEECWRGWNSWFHDDWRRKGDVLVYCLRDNEKVKAKQRKEKEKEKKAR